jgi:hypothetical protein
LADLTASDLIVQKPANGSFEPKDDKIIQFRAKRRHDGPVSSA